SVAGGPNILNTSFRRCVATVVASLFFIGTAIRNFENVQMHVNSHANPSLLSAKSWKSIRSIWICFHGALDTIGTISVFSLMEVLMAHAVHLFTYSCTSSCVIPIWFSEMAEYVL